MREKVGTEETRTVERAAVVTVRVGGGGADVLVEEAKSTKSEN